VDYDQAFAEVASACAMICFRSPHVGDVDALASKSTAAHTLASATLNEFDDTSPG
jgi:hypothetical protein